MGDPKLAKKKYSGPAHPWQSKRIEKEKGLLEEYGLKNKKEIWKAESLLKNFAAQAKKLIAVKTAQGEKERKQLFQRLEKLGLLKAGAALDDILELSINNILDRRLQTFVFKKGFSRTINQARQFITHQHVTVGDKLVTIPSYIVTVDEEPSLKFLESSTLSNESHPERAVEEKTDVKVKKGGRREVKPLRKGTKRSFSKEEKAEAKKIEKKVDVKKSKISDISRETKSFTRDEEKKKENKEEKKEEKIEKKDVKKSKISDISRETKSFTREEEKKTEDKK